MVALVWITRCLLGGSALVVALGSCSSESADGGAATHDDDDCPVGTLGCACTSGGACDPGLECRSELCVDPGGATSGDDGDGSGSGGGSDGGVTRSTTTGGVGSGGSTASTTTGITASTNSGDPTTSYTTSTGATTSTTADPGSSTSSMATSSGPSSTTTGGNSGSDPLAACIDAVDGGWTFETADNGSNVGSYAQLGIDSAGNLHVTHSALYSPGNTLKYSVRTGNGWTTTDLDTREGTNTVSSIAVGSNDYLYVAYRWSEAPSTGHIMFASKEANSGNWGRSPLDSGVPSLGANAHVTVDDQNEAHIVYTRLITDAAELWYLEYEGASWKAPVLVDTLGAYGVGRYPSIRVATDGTVYVAYYDEPNGQLKVATRNGGWGTTVVDGHTDDSGEYSWLELDSNDVPHVLYVGANPRGLVSASKPATQWEIDEVGHTLFPFNVTAVFDASNDLHVTYLNSELGYGRRTGSNWQWETIATGLTIEAGRRTGIKLSPNERQVHIIYQDVDLDDLLYATCGPG